MSNIDNLLRQSIEIESLLRLLRDRDSLEARSMLGEKIDAYLGAVKAFLAAPAGHDAPEAAQAEAEGREVLAEAHAVEVKDQEAVEAEDRSEGDLAADAVKKEEAEAPAPAEIEAERPAEEPAPAEAHAEAPTAAAPKAKSLAESLPRDHSHRSLMKAFTLNERFRFIRDVFNGDPVDFENTVHVLEDFDSPEEVADYIYDELMLDPSSTDVADFVAHVQAYLKN